MMTKSNIVTRADVEAAIARIAAGNADPEDLNCVRSELSRLWIMAEMNADEDELPEFYRQWARGQGAQ